MKETAGDLNPSITTQTAHTDLADRDDVKVGVWLTPQHTTTERLRRAWRAADALGVDSIWLWDHFYPLTGDPEGTHFEAWSLLAVMAVETRTATIGPLVGNYLLRNPDLLADMARTVDHLSDGRLVLGLGAGWVERDLVEYGYPLLAPRERVDGLVETLDRVQRRFAALNPPPRGPVPLLIGADGPRMLRLVAERASIWNTMAWKFAEGNAALDENCRRIGRDPAEIERSVFVVEPPTRGQLDELVRAGARHVIHQIGDPFDLAPVEDTLAFARRAQLHH